MNDKIVQTMEASLFADEDLGVFALLDGASIPSLLENLYEQQPEYVCLYRGELTSDMAEVAPYLVKLEPDTDFTEWMLEKGWGNHWGVFAFSRESLSALRRHFRKFLIVYDPENKPIYFRYYDPRVLRTYLPTCSPQDLDTVFGPVESYLLEDESAKFALRFRKSSESLQQEKITLL